MKINFKLFNIIFMLLILFLSACAQTQDKKILDSSVQNTAQLTGIVRIKTAPMFAVNNGLIVIQLLEIQKNSSSVFAQYQDFGLLQFPKTFSIPYEQQKINPKNTYFLKILVGHRGGGLLYKMAQEYQLFEKNSSTNIDLTLIEATD